MSDHSSKFVPSSRLSRRNLLRGASAGAALSFAAPALAWTSPQSSDTPRKLRVAATLPPRPCRRAGRSMKFIAAGRVFASA